MLSAAQAAQKMWRKVWPFVMALSAAQAAQKAPPISIALIHKLSAAQAAQKCASPYTHASP